jgi:phage baseplate assembly protein V
MDLAPDHARRIESLIRLGTVAEVDHARARCRVTSGSLTTDWLPWLALRAGTTRTWNPPTVGEQVLVLSPSGETAAGVVLIGIYSDTAKPPSNEPAEDVRLYPDGARIRYNHATGALEATGVKTALVQASGHCTLDTPLTTITGDLVVEGKATVRGLFTYLAGLAGYGTGQATTVIIGPLTQSDGALSSNGIVLHAHTHGGVKAGSDSTAGPQ